MLYLKDGFGIKIETFSRQKLSLFEKKTTAATDQKIY